MLSPLTSRENPNLPPCAMECLLLFSGVVLRCAGTSSRGEQDRTAELVDWSSESDGDDYWRTFRWSARVDEYDRSSGRALA